jgi:hypothetical protein
LTGIPAHIDRDRLALGIQQPWAELILRGEKTIEVRSQPTQVRGMIYLYTSKKPSPLECARVAAVRHGVDEASVPRGLLVGSIEILDCRPCTRADVSASGVTADLLVDRSAWVLGNPVRWEVPLPVRFLPYGVWFYPFQRRQQSARKR